MEDILQVALGWFVREIVGFGLRWLVVGLPMLGFGGFLGWRYLAMKRKITNLEEELSKLPPTVRLTQDEYNALPRKDPNTTYFVVDKPRDGHGE